MSARFTPLLIVVLLLVQSLTLHAQNSMSELLEQLEVELMHTPSIKDPLQVMILTSEKVRVGADEMELQKFRKHLREYLENSAPFCIECKTFERGVVVDVDLGQFKNISPKLLADLVKPTLAVVSEEVERYAKASMQRNGGADFNEEELQILRDKWAIPVDLKFLRESLVDQDSGLMRMLPPPPQEGAPPILKERDVFEILISPTNQLLVERQLMDVDGLKKAYRSFLTNPNQSPDLPVLQEVTKEGVEQQLAALANHIKADPENTGLLKRKKLLERKLEAVQLIGNYQSLPDQAVVSLQTARNASYDYYVQVQAALTDVVNELRDAYAQKHFGVAYDALDSSNPEHQKMKNALKMLYPLRVVEVEAKDMK